MLNTDFHENARLYPVLILCKFASRKFREVFNQKMFQQDVGEQVIIMCNYTSHASSIDVKCCMNGLRAFEMLQFTIIASLSNTV